MPQEMKATQDKKVMFVSIIFFMGFSSILAFVFPALYMEKDSIRYEVLGMQAVLGFGDKYNFNILSFLGYLCGFLGTTLSVLFFHKKHTRYYISSALFLLGSILVILEVPFFKLANKELVEGAKLTISFGPIIACVALLVAFVISLYVAIKKEIKDRIKV